MVMGKGNGQFIAEINEGKIKVINRFGEEVEITELDHKKNGVETDYGFWNYNQCLNCFVNRVLGTKKECLGKCTTDDPNFQYRSTFKIEKKRSR